MDLVTRLRTMDNGFQRLTGREALGYISAPTPTSLRVAFGDGHVATSATKAIEHMSHLLTLAQTAPTLLPYPFDQELTAEQDLRVINGWPRPVRSWTHEATEAENE